ncbi:Reverse transcriptase zinc-binding domain [Sesbania bispinosa]|nr:Reverse transcriptase zinc-binding domain [Sesbania bispinosa]
MDVWVTSVVSKFADSASGWNVLLLRSVLPEEVVLEILGYPHPQDDFGADLVVWGGTSNGIFSTKSAHNLVSHREVAIWRWDGPERARYFMWLVANNGLKTRSKGFRCGLFDSDTCPVCQQSEETSLHVLPNCTAARKVWSGLDADCFPT